MKRELILKDKNMIDKIRESWKILTEILHNVWKMSVPGANLLDLEKYTQQSLDKYKVKWAFKWYMWYPANLCLSIDDCVVHWIPNNYNLKLWELLKIDFWVNYNWAISDAAISVVVGWEKANPLAANLVNATKFALDEWLKYVWDKKVVFDYSNCIYSTMKANWFEVIKCLTGHWVWKHVHEAPYLYNRPHRDTQNMYFQKWMVVALEPITAMVSTDVYQSKNWWNLYTNKWDYWAQREYTVAVTDNWYEILAWIK